MLVPDTREDVPAEAVFDEHPGDIGQRRPGRLEERVDRVLREVMRTRTLVIRPEVREDGDDAGGDEVMLPFVDRLEHVDADGVVEVPTRVQMDDIRKAMMRNEVKHFLSEVTVWFDEGEAVAALEVLTDHRFEPRALTHAATA